MRKECKEKNDWMNEGFITKELYAPFIIEKDNDYLKELNNKLSVLLEQAKRVNADKESISIIENYSSMVLKAVDSYYQSDVEECYKIIRELIKDIGEDDFAVSKLKDSFAFPGEHGKELQFFRARNGDPSMAFSTKDMLHLPYSKRAKTGNNRFGIPGNPCYYLANSSYGCWIETGFPPDYEFNVSPVLLEGEQKILNLAVSIRDFSHLNECEKLEVHTWLKIFILMIATSFRIEEINRTFKSEYIVSQAIMIACKKLGYSGVAYYSKRVSDEMFAFCAINLALFIEYEGEYSDLVNHMKIGEPFNYSLYKNLLLIQRHKEYELRSVKNGLITNIGDYDKQIPYNETEFIMFDKFLFSVWERKPNGKGKNQIPWKVEID